MIKIATCQWGKKGEKLAKTADLLLGMELAVI